MRFLTATCLRVLLASLAACSVEFHKRDGEGYRKDTRAMLDTKSGAIKACYDELLKADPTVAGKVVVNFTVQGETGKITDPTVDQAQTTAPEALSHCVLAALDGAALEPPDKCPAKASYTWEFAPQG